MRDSTSRWGNASVFYGKKVKRRKRKASATLVEKKHKARSIRVAFYDSREWKKLRYEALKLHGAKCQCCGVSSADGARLNVDYIRPRSQFPELALELMNLQVLCSWYNVGKGAWDQTDWRAF